MLHVAPEILAEVMQHRAHGADRSGAMLQAEAIQRRHLEMLAHGEHRRLRREHPVVVGDDDGKSVLQQLKQLARLRRIDDLRRAQPLQFCEQRSGAWQFGGLEAAGGQIHQGESVNFTGDTHGGEEVVALGDKHPFIEVRAGREDLRDLTFDELAGAGFFNLIADGDLASGLENARDVTVGGMEGDAAHRDDAALGERDVEQLRAALRVLEEHLVEIAEAEQQQRIFRQLAFDAAILRHHGRELGFAGHAGATLGEVRQRVEVKFYTARAASSRWFTGNAAASSWWL